MADYTMKRGDLGQQITRRLYEQRVSESLNLTTGQVTSTITYQQVPLVSGDTVKVLLKQLTSAEDVSPPTFGVATGGGSATFNTTTSEVTYTLQAADVNAVRLWAMEIEVTKTATGEVITFPDEPDPERGHRTAYYTVAILEDLG